MNKILIHNEEQYVALFRDFEIHEAERFLGVEFAFVDGSFHSDFIFGDTKFDEDQSVSHTIYRKRNDSNFPKSYPCLVLLANDKDYDRTGPTKFEMLEFVYESDFKIK